MKKNILILMVSSCFISLFLSGCSTISRGTKQAVRINSSPNNATVAINGREQVTPAVFSLKGEASGYNVVAKKPGYKTTHSHIDSDFRAGTTILGNILWLLPGVIVDLMTGSAYELQDNVHVNMQKKK